MKTNEQIQDEKGRLIELVKECQQMHLKAFEDKAYAQQLMDEFCIEPSYDGSEVLYDVEEYLDNRIMTGIDNCAKYCGESFDDIKEWVYAQPEIY
jgi:hypothetical protein